MSKLIALLALLAFSAWWSMLLMIHGYGVQPRSYAWVFGFGIIGQIVIQVAIRAIDKEK